MTSESHEVPFPATDSGNWQLQHAESLLSALDGVNSVKIVTDDQGSIQEIHVLSGSDIGAKQIVRNVESALLAELGLQVDHRKISVARMRENDLEEIRASQNGPITSGGRRLVLSSVQIERRAGRTARCRVELTNGEQMYPGEAEGSDSTRTRSDIAAEAVLNALRQAMETDASPLILEGVKMVDAFGRQMVLAVVRVRSGRNPIPLSGCSAVLDSPEEAAVLAVLQATNRWVAESLGAETNDEED